MPAMGYRSTILIAVPAVVIILLFVVAITYSRSILVNDTISIGGKLEGTVRAGLWLVDRESGRRIYSASMTEERLLSFAPFRTDTALVEDPSSVDVYLVVNVTYSVRDMEYLKANVTAVHHYERELGLEPREQKLIRSIASDDGTHVETLKVYLGTLDYFMWLDYYARGLVISGYSYPFEPPTLCADFEEGYELNEKMWDYGGHVNVVDGVLRVGSAEYTGATTRSWIRTERTYDLDALSASITVRVLTPVRHAYVAVGALYTSVNGFDIVFDDYEYYIWTLYARDGTTSGVYEKSGKFDEVEAWHTANITISPTDEGSRVLIRMDGEVVYDKVIDLGRTHPCNFFYVYVIQSVGSICYADIDYVAIGSAVSDRFLDWYIRLTIYGRDTGGKYHSVSKDLYGSFGSGEPSMNELAIRPAGVLYYTADQSLLSFARTLSLVLHRLGIVRGH